MQQQQQQSLLVYPCANQLAFLTPPNRFSSLFFACIFLPPSVSSGARASQDMPELLSIAAQGGVDLPSAVTRRFTMDQEPRTASVLFLFVVLLFFLNRHCGMFVSVYLSLY